MSTVTDTLAEILELESNTVHAREIQEKLADFLCRTLGDEKYAKCDSRYFPALGLPPKEKEFSSRLLESFSVSVCICVL